jgi:hypothetical protein
MRKKVSTMISSKLKKMKKWLTNRFQIKIFFIRSLAFQAQEMQNSLAYLQLLLTQKRLRLKTDQLIKSKEEINLINSIMIWENLEHMIEQVT